MLEDGVTLGSDPCNVPRNEVLPFARQVAGMVLHCAMILELVSQRPSQRTGGNKLSVIIGQ